MNQAAQKANEEQGHKPWLNVVLFQPEIPQNTGNIGRSCVALNAKLWMVKPLGFRLDSSQLKRSGMDYWKDLDWECVDQWEQLAERIETKRFWLVTKFGDQNYCDVDFQSGDALVFGRESTGLPDHLHQRYQDCRIMIPMPGPVRCLNLATSAGIVMYEAARQLKVLTQPDKEAKTPLDATKLRCDA